MARKSRKELQHDVDNPLTKEQAKESWRGRRSTKNKKGRKHGKHKR